MKPPSLLGYLVAAARALAWFLTVVLLLLLPAIAAELGVGHPAWVLVTVAGLVVLGGAYALRLDDPGYALTDLGPTERVDVTTFRGSRETCANCEAATRKGIRRRYRRQWVALGIPIRTLDWGSNAYCPDCIDPDSLEPIGDPPVERGAADGTEAVLTEARDE